MNKGRDLLNKEKLFETHPDLSPLFNSLAAVFSHIVSSKRMTLGYTQQELADKAGVNLKLISKAEGTGNLNINEYEKIFQSLNLNSADVAAQMLRFTNNSDPGKTTLKDLVSKCTPENPHDEISFGGPTGRELI